MLDTVFRGFPFLIDKKTFVSIWRQPQSATDVENTIIVNAYRYDSLKVPI